MRLTRRILLAVNGTSLGLAGCVGDDETPADENTETMQDEPTGGDATDAEPASGGATDETPTASPTVQTRSHPEHGDILAGPDEMTLYMFDQDTQGEAMSTCYDGCADTWPPLTVEDEPSAGDDVTADVTNFERDDGSMQVVAGGWPLYYFTPDEAPGDVMGQGANDVWWVLSPDGSPVKPDDG